MIASTQVACDGGKDSLSMAASAGGETVMAPGNLVISAYVTCPDITKTVTPDLKLPGSGKLIHVDLAQAQKRRLGGSCLGQVWTLLLTLIQSSRSDKSMIVILSACGAWLAHCVGRWLLVLLMLRSSVL